MRKLFKTLLALSFIVFFVMGLIVGIRLFPRTKIETEIVGEAKLQEHIDNVTAEYIASFAEIDLDVKQSHLIGNLWIHCENLDEFLLLAKALNMTTLYIYWKFDFLRFPVFFIVRDNTSIIYEPF